jgi:H+-translocating NAD(P) transhydrogenase subunit alpha
MRISVPTESSPNERRVALAPDSIARLAKAGLQIFVQRGAGQRAGFGDDAYLRVGATVVDDAASAFGGGGIIVKVQPPSPGEIGLLEPGSTIVSLMQPGRNAEIVAALSTRGVTGLALELVPRITRAQSMDVLSSQATVAGYKAVLLGAERLDKFLPMLTTAAGNVTPSKVFVIGAGVAGLMAIATARRLGGVVSAFDVRPAAKEQIESLGATAVAADLVAASAEGAGGYARAQTDEERARTVAALAAHIKDMDLVVTTAQIPGKAAPRLVTADMVRAMRPGSVIVDLAAESGGNCELTRADETVSETGVTILGPVNLAASVPLHASQMFGRNVQALIGILVKEDRVDLSDEVVRAMLVTPSATPEPTAVS